MLIEPRLSGMVTPSFSTIRELAEIKYGRSEPRPFRSVYSNDRDKLVELQNREGFRLISDGQMLWGDLFRPVYEGMKGIEPGAMTRWYETNGFCFPPKIVDKPDAGTELKIQSYLYENSFNQVTIVGPYTLLRMSENPAERKPEEIIEAFTRQLIEIILKLEKGPIELIEFIEPSIVYDAKLGIVEEKIRLKALGMVLESYQEIARSVNVLTLLQLPYGNVEKTLEVFNFPVDGFGIDLTETTNPTRAVNLSGKILSAGSVNAWSSVPEDIDYLEKRVRKAIETWQPGRVFVTSNAQLYHTISHESAIRKITEIAELARRWQ